MSADNVATVLASYVSNHDVTPDDLPAVAESIRVALNESTAPAPTEDFPGRRQARVLTPKEVREAVSPAGLLCFEDNKRYKTLKRTIRKFGFEDPQQYFRKWGLPMNFPLTCTDYGEQRKRIAKEQGLGRKRS